MDKEGNGTVYWKGERGSGTLKEVEKELKLWKG